VRYFLGHDLGTGGVKAALVGEDGARVASAIARYPLHHPRPGWAEQDPEDWWRAVGSATRAVLAEAGVPKEEVAAVTFAGQMLALCPLDAAGAPTRPAVSWLDARAGAEARRMVRRLGGERIVAAIAGASPTGKDIVAKIAWIQAHEPRVYEATRAFCDATGYLVARATGEILADQTAAGGVGLVDPATLTWSRLLAWLTGVSLDKLPPIRRSIEIAGPLRPDAAADLGLAPGTPVAVGLADIPAAAIGSGALGPGDAHVYLGTSSWIGVTLARAFAAPRLGIASVPAGDPALHLAIGESETAGACVDWLARTLAPGQGEVGAWLDALAARGTPGAGGLLFLPWMFGERSPVPDTSLRGAFVNLSLDHGPEHLLRAIFEGTALNLAWILEGFGDRTAGRPLRIIGGGAQSAAWTQVVADVTGRTVERVSHAREAGACGAALVGAVAAGALRDLGEVKPLVKVERSFEPDRSLRGMYQERLAAFRELAAPLARLGRRAERWGR
jgi:xylulokinase